MSASIVCGIDGSPDSQAALEVAARLASRLGLRLIVAHVAEPLSVAYTAAAPFGGIGARYATVNDIASEEEAAERLLERVVSAAGLADVERRPMIGIAADRLADLADDEEAEFLVEGSRGRGALKSAFLGSVSNSLVGVARCPVLIVPPGAARDS